jgi:hypothetical protein
MTQIILFNDFHTVILWLNFCFKIMFRRLMLKKEDKISISGTFYNIKGQFVWSEMFHVMRWNELSDCNRKLILLLFTFSIECNLIFWSHNFLCATCMWLSVVRQCEISHISLWWKWMENIKNLISRNDTILKRKTSEHADSIIHQSFLQFYYDFLYKFLLNEQVLNFIVIDNSKNMPEWLLRFLIVNCFLDIFYQIAIFGDINFISPSFLITVRNVICLFYFQLAPFGN